MCGIFGLYANSKSELTQDQVETLTDSLFTFSQARGKDSAGISFLSEKGFDCFKKNVPAHVFLKEPEFKNILNSALKNSFSQEKISKSLQFIGHCRMVTNGTQENNANNQPILKKNQAIVHNGIICNVEKLWKENTSFKKQSDVDTEILSDLVDADLASIEDTSVKIQYAFSKIEGSASIALLTSTQKKLILATNTGSLFYVTNKQKDFLIFASEDYILRESLKTASIDDSQLDFSVQDSRQCVVLDFATSTVTKFKLNYNTPSSDTSAADFAVKSIKGSSISTLENGIQYRLEEIRAMKRCSRCVLPESFPFISFNSDGVCNYCLNYKVRSKQKNEDDLRKIVNEARQLSSSQFDCIVPFSGGRDSSYGLHYLVKDLGLKPITYTYDWGMVTDLARRNISRVCASLGVENILISADIKKKRTNVRKNVTAWLKKPDLGMIPLFMAGDKQFLFYVNKIKEQTNVNLDIWMPNHLENTDFKTGFCGIEPFKDKKRIDALPLSSKMKMISYYAKNYLSNPSYINSSLADTAFAYFSYYFEPRNHYTVLFDYIPWDEKVINTTLIDGYNWETSPDSPSTWRIGDGTAPFYNYIYTTVAGFSEIDTFRSNQIREGLISRDEALRLVELENYPRVQSLKWYLDILGLDFHETLKVINNIPRLY